MATLLPGPVATKSYLTADQIIPGDMIWLAREWRHVLEVIHGSANVAIISTTTPPLLLDEPSMQSDQQITEVQPETEILVARVPLDALDLQ